MNDTQRSQAIPVGRASERQRAPPRQRKEMQSKRRRPPPHRRRKSTPTTSSQTTEEAPPAKALRTEQDVSPKREQDTHGYRDVLQCGDVQPNPGPFPRPHQPNTLRSVRVSGDYKGRQARGIGGCPTSMPPPLRNQKWAPKVNPTRNNRAQRGMAQGAAVPPGSFRVHPSHEQLYVAGPPSRDDRGFDRRKCGRNGAQPESRFVCPRCSWHAAAEQPSEWTIAARNRHQNRHQKGLAGSFRTWGRPEPSPRRSARAPPAQPALRGGQAFQPWRTHQRPAFQPWRAHQRPASQPWRTQQRPASQPWRTHQRPASQPWRTHQRPSPRAEMTPKDPKNDTQC